VSFALLAQYEQEFLDYPPNDGEIFIYYPKKLSGFSGPRILLRVENSVSRKIQTEVDL
jgi:hypothetical protein